MGTWEDELELDLSDIWAAGSKPGQPQEAAAEEEKDDDLAFPSRASAQPANQADRNVFGFGLGLGVVQLRSEDAVTPVLSADVANAPTQVASLSGEPYVSRGGASSTLPDRIQTNPKQNLPPLPPFQPVISCEVPPTVVPVQVPGLRNPNLKEKGGAPVDIRTFFSHRGSSSGGGGEGASRKKPRIPGPVGDLFRNGEGNVVDGDGKAAFGSGEDEFNDRMFSKGAWICALRSLNVEEFDPARYAILKVTASSIGSSRTQQVPHFVAVIKELTPNVFGDAAVTLKDPTGTVAGMMHNKVFSNTDYARNISPGAVIVLKQVAVFSPSAHYLNITISNVVQVFPANTDVPQGSAPKQQKEPLPQHDQPPQPQPQPQQQYQQEPQPQMQPSSPRQENTSDAGPRSHSPPLPYSPQGLQLVEPRSQLPPQEGPQAPDAMKTASWDLLSPSPSPSPPREEAKASEGVAAAAKMAGWDDMEALLNEDVDDFYA